MADVETGSLPVIAVTAAVGAVVLLLGLFCSVIKNKDKGGREDESGSAEKTDAKDHAKGDKHGSRKQKNQPRSKKPPQIMFTHPWLSSSLKGHSGRVLSFDFSSNGKYLASASEDRTVLLWSVKEFSQKEHKVIRGNVEYDHATHVKFSPDSKAYLVSTSVDNALRVYKIGKKDDGSTGNITLAVQFEKKSVAEIINIGIASSGKFIMTCHSDTTMLVWDLKGDILATIDTHQMNNSHGAVSPCGRFVASSGFTPDVKVWEVGFDKGGNFKEVTRAFELKGHKAGVHSFSFSNDSSRMASVSKDGTWRFWDTDIRYNMGQDPYLLYTGTFESPQNSLICLSPDGRTVAIAADTSVTIFSTANGEKEQNIEDIHNTPVTWLGFDMSNRYLLTAGDKHIHILHNVAGYKSTIADLKEKEKSATSQAMKERIRQQIDEARERLLSITGEVNGAAQGK